jgi:hypothetical protein
VALTDRTIQKVLILTEKLVELVWFEFDNLERVFQVSSFLLNFKVEFQNRNNLSKSKSEQSSLLNRKNGQALLLACSSRLIVAEERKESARIRGIWRCLLKKDFVSFIVDPASYVCPQRTGKPLFAADT